MILGQLILIKIVPM